MGDMENVWAEHGFCANLWCSGAIARMQREAQRVIRGDEFTSYASSEYEYVTVDEYESSVEEEDGKGKGKVDKKEKGKEKEKGKVREKEKGVKGRVKGLLKKGSKKKKTTSKSKR